MRSKAGHRIRLDLSSGNFPYFDVNPNTGGLLGVERRFELAHQAIYQKAAQPSQVILSLIRRASQ
jgi:predicted acyl esterase